MYRNAYQRGMLTVFFSVGSKPLAIWDTHTQDGYVTRLLDPDIKSMVLEIGGTNVSTTYITCPKGNVVLGVTMPFLVMVVKNLKKYFSFEVTILDDTKTRRRFRVSNFQSTTQILPLCTVMPIGLADGWNQIQFNLAEFTRRAYKKQYIEAQKLKINANIRLRRIYFAERLMPDDQLPPEYKLYFPLKSKSAKDKRPIQTSNKENLELSTSQQKSKKDSKSKLVEDDGDLKIATNLEDKTVGGNVEAGLTEQGDVHQTSPTAGPGSRKQSVEHLTSPKAEPVSTKSDEHLKSPKAEPGSKKQSDERLTSPKGEPGSRKPSNEQVTSADVEAGSTKQNDVPETSPEVDVGSRKQSIVSAEKVETV